MLRDVISPTIKMILENFGMPYTYNKSDNIFKIMGTDLLLRSADEPDRLRGLNLYDAFLDEASYIKKGVFEVVIARTRESEDSQIFISTTPKGTRSWVYDVTMDKGTNVIYQSTFDNPFLPSSYIEHLKSQYTSQFAEQELQGKFIDFSAGVIDPNWFNVIQNTADISRKVRFWDVAVSIKKNADNSSGAKCSKGRKFTIHDIVKGKFEYPELRRKIINTAYADGKDTIIGVEDAGQQQGFIADLKRCKELNGFIIKAQRPKGDKLNRALPWVSRAELGDVDLVNGGWVLDFKDECASFSGDDSHDHDDQIDSVSGAYHMLSEGRTGVFSASFA
jgi:predicted phage terminase large subunit-like protein